VRAETRHQLKQDRFNRVTIGAAEATVHWTVAHKSKLLVAAAVLVAAIAAATGGWYYINQRNDQASLELEQAVRTLQTPLRPPGIPAQAEYPTFASDNERATAAHKQFQSIVDKYAHTHSADFARYFVAVTDASMGNNAAAEREFSEAAMLRDRDIAALAQFALASVYRSGNRTKDAIDLYKKLIDKPAITVGKPTAQIALAETYQAAGQLSEAKRILEQIQKENPASETAQLASQKLQDLK
jgi:tetratricopeptide (TPR) repeat protein